MSDVLSAQVTVTSAKVKLVTAVQYGQKVLIANRDTTNSFFVGNSSVATTTGMEAKPNALFSNGWLDVPPETEIWAIATVSQTPRCDVLQVLAD